MALNHDVEEALVAVAGYVAVDADALDDELYERGFVQVVRCGECQYWGGNRGHAKYCSVCAGRLKEGKGFCYGHFIEIIDGVLTKAEDFCPYGERLVAKSATTETIAATAEKSEK